MIDKEFIDYNPDKEQVPSATHSDRENDRYLRGKEYVTEIALLAKCTSFISAQTSGTLGVMMMADKFEHTYFFNLGRYGVINLEDLYEED